MLSLPSRPSPTILAAAVSNFSRAILALLLETGHPRARKEKAHTEQKRDDIHRPRETLDIEICPDSGGSKTESNYFGSRVQSQHQEQERGGLDDAQGGRQHQNEPVNRQG